MSNNINKEMQREFIKDKIDYSHLKPGRTNIQAPTKRKPIKLPRGEK